MDKDKIDEINKILKAGGNVIKTRDDRELILIDKDGKVQNEEACNWLPDDGKEVDNATFRSRIEPWLTSLFQSEHLSLLCGSGITNAISYLAEAGGGTTMGAASFSQFKNEIEEAAEVTAKASGLADIHRDTAQHAIGGQGAGTDTGSDNATFGALLRICGGGGRRLCGPEKR